MTRAPTASCALEVEIRLDPDGPGVAVEAVQEGDFLDARADLWRMSCPARGHPEVAPDELVLEVEPIPRKEGGDVLAGFGLATLGPDGERSRCVFPTEALDAVASRGWRRLIEEKRLGAEEPWFYVLRNAVAAVDPSEDDTALNRGEAEQGVRLLGRPVNRPVLSLPLSLAAVRRESERVGTSGEDGEFPVFFTREARDRAEIVCRRGADQDPPIETGGVLIGPLCFCEDERVLFCVVTDVIEAAEAEATTFSLSFTSRTWTRIQAVLRARQSQPETAADTVLGSTHNHPFLPAGGAEPCEACATREICSRTTAKLSAEDCRWSRAVFRGQPWQLAQVFGLDARHRPVESLNSLSSGMLLPRDYHVIPEFPVRPHGP